MTQAQAAALVMSANNSLSHTPPATWTCYSADGNAGAMNSNLTLGAMGVASIVGYMDDPGPSNTAYRVFSERADANHRYMVLRSLRDFMATLGWKIEGDGADLVVMCVPPALNP